MRITSPPIVNPCYLGVDMATRDELIAANFTVEQIRERIGADSLGYLSVEGLVGSVGRDRKELCLGCLTGEYPETAKRNGKTAPQGSRRRPTRRRPAFRRARRPALSPWPRHSLERAPLARSSASETSARTGVPVGPFAMCGPGVVEVGRPGDVEVDPRHVGDEVLEERAGRLAAAARPPEFLRSAISLLIAVEIRRRAGGCQ